MDLKMIIDPIKNENRIERALTIFENLKWLNSDEAVVYLRLPSIGALRNLVYRRQIPFVKFGSRLRFHKDSLDQFLLNSGNRRR